MQVQLCSLSLQLHVGCVLQPGSLWLDLQWVEHPLIFSWVLETWWKRSEMSEKEKGGGSIHMKKQGGRPFLSDPVALIPNLFNHFSIYILQW